ncbi:MAG: spore protease YyaC [Firmicutes bacterium]|nr:spore protease YyaC [Bacillota bacterium]
MTGFLYNNLQNKLQITSYKLQVKTKDRLFCPVRGYEDAGLLRRLSSLVLGRGAVVACVGTDLVGGDCLGPLVGQLLVEGDAPAYVYGTLTSPVNALNVVETGEFIRLTHPDRVVIAVDSAVGNKSEEGQIMVSGEPLRPGLALGKNLGNIGDISLTVTTSYYAPDKKEFSLVRLGFIYSLAKRVAGLIMRCLHDTTNRLYDTLYSIDKECAIKNGTFLH